MGNFSSQVFFKEHQIKMIKVIEDMKDTIPKVYLTVISRVLYLIRRESAFFKFGKFEISKYESENSNGKLKCKEMVNDEYCSFNIVFYFLYCIFALLYL